MDGPPNDTMTGKADNIEDDDLYQHYKYLRPVEKRQYVMKQRKIDVFSSKKQMNHDDYVEREDLMAHYKYNSTKDKVVTKETSATPSNFEASHYQQNKISRRPSATASASKHHRATANWSTSNSMKVGTRVYLQRWKNQNKTVAMGILVSCDPTQKLDGVQIGKEFWMVSVSFAMVPDEPLIRPYKEYKVLRDVGRVYVAWPSTCIEKIDI